jgi:hypothetical protein
MAAIATSVIMIMIVTTITKSSKEKRQLLSHLDSAVEEAAKIMIKNKLRYLGVRDSSSSNSSSSLSKIMELRMPLDDNAIAENIKSYLHHYISS